MPDEVTVLKEIKITVLLTINKCSEDIIVIHFLLRVHSVTTEGYYYPHYRQFMPSAMSIMKDSIITMICNAIFIKHLYTLRL